MIFIDFGIKDRLHEIDKKHNPERHFLTKDSYHAEETLGMCSICSETYKWPEQLEYDARTNKFYKKR